MRERKSGGKKEKNGEVKKKKKIEKKIIRRKRVSFLRWYRERRRDTVCQETQTVPCVLPVGWKKSD